MSDDQQLCASADLVAAGLSVAREHIIEQRLVSELAALMLRRGVTVDVLKSQFDAQGHDVVFEAHGAIRHVQLKASVAGGARRDVNINVKLRAKPSGCVVWMTYDAATLAITEYRWFGEELAQPLPDLGSKVMRHSKGDATGVKAARPALRNVPRSRFELLGNLDELATRLFGPARSQATGLVLAQLRERFGTEWRHKLAITPPLSSFHDATDFAHLVDGYRVLEQLCELDPAAWLDRAAACARAGQFSDDLGLLWTQLFLEHRRWRQASPYSPEGEELQCLDELARRVGHTLTRELAS